ncbi:PLAC8-domain-containing protein [Auricularia subglabra TFB-10046 SS5]|uniref:PLAC8-domain-containing protein n=1 Tax=Auricularia subglabra (strain TFB-10046 / SS5) TaxID=717982 RepID=J0WUE2_AURST|nr:PLAC8-domain-containing protein [Auricularia subglabra TFB-10046 SS5]
MGNHQMQPTPMMHQNGGNRNAKNLPLDSHGEREWSEGICGCCGAFGTCIYATCCPCMVYGKNKSRREQLDQTGTAHAGGGSACGGDCCLHAALLLCGLGWILQIGERGATRRRYGIGGGCFGDCCAVFWCNPCALTQESQEIRLEEKTLRR